MSIQAMAMTSLTKELGEGVGPMLDLIDLMETVYIDPDKKESLIQEFTSKYGLDSTQLQKLNVLVKVDQERQKAMDNLDWKSNDR